MAKIQKVHARLAGMLTALREGTKTAEQLCEMFEVTVPTVIQTVELSDGKILTLGKTKGRRYGLSEPLRGGLADVPVYQITEQGNVELKAYVLPLAADEFWWQPADGSLGSLSVGLPPMLSDFRPQGFLGRTWAKAHEALGLPAEVKDWTSRDVLLAASLRGEDLIGHYIVGVAASERLMRMRMHSNRSQISREDRLSNYSRLAASALAGDEDPGSSAGGEQPKFLAQIADGQKNYSVIVKFTGTLGNPVSDRWADLLHAESVAMSVLIEAGVPAARAEVLSDGNRVYLESERFDRVGSQGRVGVISLRAFSEPEGFVDFPWAKAIDRMVNDKMLTKDSRQRVRDLVEFSILIGNGDRHHGNLSILESGNPPWELAPAYDILPMAYSPRTSGEIVSDPLTFPAPTMDGLPYRKRMLPFALSFWERLSQDTTLSDEFRNICTVNVDAVLRHAAELGVSLQRTVQPDVVDIDALAERLRNGETGSDIPMQMAMLGCDGDQARQLIAEQRHDEALELLEDATAMRLRGNRLA